MKVANIGNCVKVYLESDGTVWIVETRPCTGRTFGPVALDKEVFDKLVEFVEAARAEAIRENG